MSKIRRVAGEESELCCRKRRDSPYRNVSSKPDSRRVVSSYYLSPWKQHMHPMIYFSPSERWKVQQWANSPPPSLCLFSCLRHCNATHQCERINTLTGRGGRLSVTLCVCLPALHSHSLFPILYLSHIPSVGWIPPSDLYYYRKSCRKERKDPMRMGSHPFLLLLLLCGITKSIIGKRTGEKKKKKTKKTRANCQCRQRRQHSSQIPLCNDYIIFVYKFPCTPLLGLCCCCWSQSRSNFRVRSRRRERRNILFCFLF